MFFNKRIFIFVSCFFISSCGLEIGEKAPGAPEYYLPNQPGICSQLGDYKKIFLDYFFKDEPFSDKVSQALSCISLKIRGIKSLIKHEHLNKQQTVNVLNQDFIQKSYMKKAVNNILDPDYFYNYVSIKNNLVHLIQPNLKRDYLKPDWICKVRPNDDNIVSKKSVDTLVYFLESMSELFFSAEEDAYILFDEFFASRSISQFELQVSQKTLIEFGEFLSDYLSEIFPSYSQFLKSKIEKTRLEETIKVKKYREELDHMTIGGEELNKTPIEKAMAPLLSSLSLPFLKGSKIGPQNLKYMMLNIYLMQGLLEVYDLDKDFILSSQELKSLSCLMAPLVSILTSSELKGEWEIIQKTYNPIDISNYIIKYKSLPPRERSFKSLFDSNTWRFVWFRIHNSKDLSDQSYTELSQLISLLFLEFFNKIQFEHP